MKNGLSFEVENLKMGIKSIFATFILLLKFSVKYPIVFGVLMEFQFPSLVTYKGSYSSEKYPINTISIINSNGYLGESHTVRTADGYLLQLHRILPKKQSQQNPVLLMHGNFQTSADWVINSPTNASLAFILSNEGYDVYLGNHRGNTYSNRHVNYSPNSHEFWDFSFHEMGKYDVPAMIDYVLEQTGAEQLHYMSFSYSTTAFFAALSLRPEYNDRIATGIVMGPSVFQRHLYNGLVSYFSFTSYFIDKILKIFGALPILPRSIAKILHNFLPILCNSNLDRLGACVNFLRLFFGHDGGLIRKEQMALITAVAPSTSGLKAWNHILQLSGSGLFLQYDFGWQKNLKLYGKWKPASYNLTCVIAPIILMVGANDLLAHQKDAKRLAVLLPNLIESYKVPYAKFTHLDFTYGGVVAEEQVYRYAIQIMKNADMLRNNSSV